MSIKTRDSLSGFIASEPQLSYTKRGDARFYAKIGVEHQKRNDDGTSAKAVTFHDLVQYRWPAERSHKQFRKGDWFIAEGSVHTFPREVDGKTVDSEEFVATKLGHDTSRTNYAVNRVSPGAANRVQAPTRSSSRRAELPPVASTNHVAPPEHHQTLSI